MTQLTQTINHRMKSLYTTFERLPDMAVALIGAANITAGLLTLVQILSGIVSVSLGACSLFVLWPKIMARIDEIRNSRR